ncbi:MAG: pantothenate kinase [Sulfurihydrogenibium sp.]|nr:MAG: pantothenate kinase [Sulfurihydrogenibium sp.]
MILGIDIGNTTVEVALIKDLENIKSMKFKTDLDKTPDDWLLNFHFLHSFFNEEKSKVEHILVSSVVPQIDNSIKTSIAKYYGIKPIFIGKDLNIPIKINYENPSQVGVDRLLNSFAALQILSSPIICIDFGTAITFDIANRHGEYDGGLIFPGIETSIKCLFSKTAKLPKVSMEKPNSVVGKNTVNSIQSGLYYGYLSLVEGVIERIESFYKEDFNVVITGGNANLILQDLQRKVFYEPKLPMKGIFYLAKSHLK